MKCVCVWLGAVWHVRGGDEWIRGLGLNVAYQVETGGVLSVADIAKDRLELQMKQSGA